MKKYTSERVDALLKKMGDEVPVLKVLKHHRAITDRWRVIPDEKLRRIDIKVSIDEDGVLTLLCPSSVLLNYVRSQRLLIEAHLQEVMAEGMITELRISLST